MSGIYWELWERKCLNTSVSEADVAKRSLKQTVAQANERKRSRRRADRCDGKETNAFKIACARSSSSKTPTNRPFEYDLLTYLSYADRLRLSMK